MVSCMPSTSFCSHTSMCPCTCTVALITRPSSSSVRKGVLSPCLLCISVILKRSWRSKDTDLMESNSPLWKCCCTASGSEPSERISSSVGSDTK